MPSTFSTISSGTSLPALRSVGSINRPESPHSGSAATVGCVISRMCLSHLFLTLDKWAEFYDRFHHVVPADCLPARGLTIPPSLLLRTDDVAQ